MSDVVYTVSCMRIPSMKVSPELRDKKCILGFSQHLGRLHRRLHLIGSRPYGRHSESQRLCLSRLLQPPRFTPVAPGSFQPLSHKVSVGLLRVQEPDTYLSARPIAGTTRWGTVTGRPARTDGKGRSPLPWQGYTCGSRHNSASSAWSGSCSGSGHRHLRRGERSRVRSGFCACISKAKCKATSSQERSRVFDLVSGI